MQDVIVEIELGYIVARKSVQKQNTKRMLGNESLQPIPKSKSKIQTPGSKVHSVFFSRV